MIFKPNVNNYFVGPYKWKNLGITRFKTQKIIQEQLHLPYGSLEKCAVFEID